MRRLLTQTFDPDGAWRVASSVSLRPEPFGALVYNFSTRKLTFLKSTLLLRVVRALAENESVHAALDTCAVPAAERPAYLRALAGLADSQMIEPCT